MKRIFCMVLVCLACCFGISAVSAQEITEIPPKTGAETTIGIETYGENSDYTGWITLKLTVLDDETGEPIANVVVRLVRADNGEIAGTGPNVSEPNPEDFFPIQGIPPITGSNGQFLTNENGEILLRVYPTPVEYRLEVNYDGYEAYVGDAFSLTSDGITEVRLKKQTEESEPTPSSPQTGDSTNLWLYIMLVAALTVVIVSVWRRKKQNS